MPGFTPAPRWPDSGTGTSWVTTSGLLRVQIGSFSLLSPSRRSFPSEPRERWQQRGAEEVTAAPTPGRQRFPARAGSHQLLKPKGQREEKPQLCSKLKERRRGGCRRQTRDLRPLVPTQRAASGSEAPSYGRAEGREERAGAARPCPAAPPCPHVPKVSIQPHPTSLASLTPPVPNIWGHGMSCWVSLRKRPGDLSSSRPSPPLLFVPGWVQHLHLLPPQQAPASSCLLNTS